MTIPNEPGMTTPDVVNAVKSQLGDDLSEEQVANVMAAWNNLRNGDPIGMVRRQEDTGRVAHRVEVHGVHQWRVSGPDGESYNDMQPTLPWPVIHDPA